MFILRGSTSITRNLRATFLIPGLSPTTVTFWALWEVLFLTIPKSSPFNSSSSIDFMTVRSPIFTVIMSFQLFVYAFEISTTSFG